MSEAVTFTPTAGVDAYGDPIAGSGVTQSVLAKVAPAGSVDVDDVGRDGVAWDYTLYLPVGTSVDPTDTVTVRGHVCRIIGIPQDWTERPGGVVVRAAKGVG